MIAPEVKERNRKHLIKALSLGLPLEGGPGCWQVGSEADPGVAHRVERRAGRWYCGCRWAADTCTDGYDPRSNVKPCKHILLAIAAELPVPRQDALVRQDPALRAAATTGYQIRSRRPSWRSGAPLTGAERGAVAAQAAQHIRDLWG